MQQPAPRYAAQPQLSRTRGPVRRSRRRSGCSGFIVNILRGAFLGDYAPDSGVAGALTQIALGYVPVVGTLCAIRDVFADWRYHDLIGVTLNLLAVFPVLGGVPKTIEVIRNLQHIGQAFFYHDDGQA